MLEYEVKMLELDRESMDALMTLLNDQRAEINPGLLEIDLQIKKLKAEILLDPDDSGLRKKLEVAEAGLEIMEERLARNCLLETLVENARPASQDIIPSGDQPHPDYANLTINQMAKIEVAERFSSAILELLTTSSPHLLDEGSTALVTTITRNKSPSDAKADLHKVVGACQHLISGGGSSSGELGIVDLFLSQLYGHLLYVSQKDDSGKLLELVIRACNVGKISPRIDWPRAIPRSRHIPNLYRSAEKFAQNDLITDGPV